MRRVASAFILALLLAVMVNAQARKLETIPNTNADNEQAYLDLLAKALGDSPSSQAFLLGYRKSDLPPGAFLRRLYGYIDYLVDKRGISPDRVGVIEGNIKPETFTEMWLVPGGAKPPVADSSLVLVPNLPLEFDTAYPDCPSEMSVYLEDLSDSLRFYARALLANPNVSARIVAYPGRRSSVRRVVRLANRARAQLVANYHIEGKRITVAANNRRRHCSQIELWLTQRH